MYKKQTNEKRRNISGKQQDRSDQKRKEKIILSRAQTLFFFKCKFSSGNSKPGKESNKGGDNRRAEKEEDCVKYIAQQQNGGSSE